MNVLQQFAFPNAEAKSGIKRSASPLPVPLGPAGDGRPYEATPVASAPTLASLTPPSLPTPVAYAPTLASLPDHVLELVASHLGKSDLHALRLTSRQLRAAASAAVRSLRPSRPDDTLLARFPNVRAVDFSAVAPGAWSESVLTALAPAPGLTALRFSQASNLTPTGAGIVASMPRLRSLEVIDAAMSDRALRQWTALSSLTSLSLLGCGWITEEGLNAVSALKDLRHVELGSCPGVTDAVLRTLGTLPHLNKLDLSSCDNFTETGIAALGAAPALHTLLLPACWHLDDGILVTLAASAPNIECLSLFEAGEGVTDVGMGQLARLTRLTALDLGYSCWGHTAEGLRGVVGALPALKMLNIGGAEGACDEVLQELATRLTNLTSLDVSECQRTSAAGVRALEALTALQELHLGWNLRLSDEALAALPQGLTKLDLSYCGDVTLRALPPGSLPALAHVQARRCGKIDDDGLAALVAAAPALHHLDFSYSVNVTSSGLRSLAELTALSSLCISGCPRAATVLGLGALAAVPSLEALEAANNPRLDDGCMQAVSFVPQLKSLSLRGCPRVSDHGVMALVRIPGLESLEIDGRGVSEGALERLRARLPRLRRIACAFRDPVRSAVNYYEGLGVGGPGQVVFAHAIA